MLRNLRSLWCCSLCNTLILLLLWIHYPYWSIFILSCVYLFFFFRRELFYYLFAIALLLLRFSFQYPPSYKGIVSEKINQNTYLLLGDYSTTEIQTNLTLIPGHSYILKGEVIQDYQALQRKNKVQNNICYRIKAREILDKGFAGTAFLRSFLYKHDAKITKFLQRFLCGEVKGEGLTYLFIVSFGLSSLFSWLLKKRHGLLKTGILLLFQILAFGIQFQVLYLFFRWFFKVLKWNEDHIMYGQIIILWLIQPAFIYSHSYIFLLFFSLHRVFSSFIHPCFIFSCLDMLFSSGIHILRIILFPWLRRLGIILYFLSLCCLLHSHCDPFLNKVIYLLEWMSMKGDFFLPGRLSLIWIIWSVLFIYWFKLKRAYTQLLILCLLLYLRVQAPACGMVFIDVGQGDATFFEDRVNHLRILIDTGDAYHYTAVKKELWNLGVRQLDYLIITHEDSDHAANAEAICRDFQVGEVIRQHGRDIRKGESEWKFLAVSGSGSKNDKSLVYYTNIDSAGFLFTGDIEASSEKELLQKYSPFPVYFLKSPHHGSATSSTTSFLESFMPFLASISTNGRYGHPSKQTLENYHKYGITYYVTQEEGSIHYEFRPLFDVLWTDKGTIQWLHKASKYVESK